jgi:integrase
MTTTSGFFTLFAPPASAATPPNTETATHHHTRVPVASAPPPEAHQSPAGVPVPVSSAPTLNDLLDAYTRDCFPKLTPETQYQNLQLYRRFRSEMGHMPLTALTPAYLQAWCHRLVQTYAPGTVRRRLYALSAMLTVAVRYYDWLSVNPMFKVIYPTNAPGRVRFLSEEELPRLLAACRRSANRHLHLVVLLAITTGGRKNELLRLRWGAVDLERGLLTFHQTKNKERRIVPVRGQALDVLRRHGWCPRPDAWVFPRADGLKPVLIDEAWQYARRRAKIPDMRFHDLRHTAASYMAMSGATLRDIAEILGHKSLKQTMAYAHLTLGHTAGVVERMVDQRQLGSSQEESEHVNTKR